jgi:hypothetical protein
VLVSGGGGGGSVHYITGELKKAAATCAPDFALAAAHIHPAHSPVLASSTPDSQIFFFSILERKKEKSPLMFLYTCNEGSGMRTF